MKLKSSGESETRVTGTSSSLAEPQGDGSLNGSKAAGDLHATSRVELTDVYAHLFVRERDRERAYLSRSTKNSNRS